MAEFTIAQGDLLPEIKTTLKDDTGTVVDLTGATVQFLMSLPGDIENPVIDDPATIILAAAGTVKYIWTGTDTATIGNYVARWRVTFADGREESFPNLTFNTVTITDNFP